MGKPRHEHGPATSLNHHTAYHQHHRRQQAPADRGFGT